MDACRDGVLLPGEAVVSLAFKKWLVFGSDNDYNVMGQLTDLG